MRESVCVRERERERESERVIERERVSVKEKKRITLSGILTQLINTQYTILLSTVLTMYI